ncbi:uncharacterized protein LOC113239604 isoform X2 [Hyposmocoma kahamanoa]|uniref:uncharacterized protein LOC113239604 isoform X2 n=1 Tax=Hyposmocoma kahamanoa TaxID=1477025 RepID=UPI000E6DA0EA|nr:uncharacterized protein LOC113239604 isoform X2 [Hyposmocoma kahamanoa]
MAARGGRRGPAPIASFDHDVSDESSPETKPPAQLPEIREDPAGTATALGVPENRARSASTPGLTFGAPRIDISRASSSSHHDSRDSSPELALFAGAPAASGELGFREDGALDLRSSTEELAFLEGAPGGPVAVAPPIPPATDSRRHSRKDSQGSEAALLAVSGRTSRLSSVGSQCSAHSVLSGFSHVSRVSRLSVTSAASRSPSPHKMLLETSFCGPRPIETDPEICAAAVEECLLERVKAGATVAPRVADPPPPAGDARDRREVTAEVTVERAPRPAPIPALTAPVADDKQRKESSNRARARSRQRRDHSQPEVYKSRNRSKDIIRIRLKPENEYDDDDDDESEGAMVDNEQGRVTRPTDLAPRSPSPHRSPSPLPPPGGVSRKSSFCSLFKSRETIASPDSPSDALRRKKSLNEGRSRSKSRDRSAPPSAAGRIRGSVLSLFRTPRRSVAEVVSPNSRAASPASSTSGAQHDRSRRSTAERLKYYEDSRDGIIHIPLRTPPDERPCSPHEAPRPASAPSAPASTVSHPPQNPTQRTVLPDGSIIIPLHSPTEKVANCDVILPTVSGRSSVPTCVERSIEPERQHVERPETPTNFTRPAAETRIESTTTKTDLGHAAGLDSATLPVESVCAAAPTATTTTTTTTTNGDRLRRRERLVFTTHVGSSEQVFSTQFSITKTPSVTSEISESVPSLAEEPRLLRDTHIAGDEPQAAGSSLSGGSVGSTEAHRWPQRDSSDEDGSSDTGARAADPPAPDASVDGGGSAAVLDVEARGLVVQESFEEELPYVPTTLPLERPLALPMVPVRERTSVHHATAIVERPRASLARTVAAVPVAAQAPVHPSGDKLRIRLPRRPRAVSAPAPPHTARQRTASTSDGGAGAGRGKGEWIDFSEVPERRKQPKRIQTLPTGSSSTEDTGGVVFSYVEPEECRCECHHAASPTAACEQPPQWVEAVELNVVVSRPFTADLDLHSPPDVGGPPTATAMAAASARRARQ